MEQIRKPTHPGEVLWEDIMKPLGLSISEAAKRLGISRKTLSAVVHGKSAVTPQLAVRIGKATKTSPESWLFMQAKLSLWMAEQEPVPVEIFEEVALG